MPILAHLDGSRGLALVALTSLAVVVVSWTVRSWRGRHRDRYSDGSAGGGGLQRDITPGREP